MGDARFDAPYQRVRQAADRARMIGSLRDVEIILALGGAARAGDAYLANVLATEALNRQRRLAAWFVAVTVGSASFIVPRILLQFFLADPRTDLPETLRLAATLLLLLLGATIALAALWRMRRSSVGFGV